jgi:hypothetical protein
MRPRLLFLGISVAAIFGFIAASIPGHAKDICDQLPQPKPILHGMTVETFKSFGDRLGIGLTYSMEGERLSIFKFDYEYETIDDAILKEFFALAIKDIYRASKIRNETINETREIGSMPFAGFPIHHFFLRASKQGASMFEFLGMGHDGKCMTKIRYTDAKSLDFEMAATNYVNHLRSLEKYVGEK